MSAQLHPKCKYCANAFDEGDHKPLHLPCGHTFCKDCLSEQEDNKQQQCTVSDCNAKWDHRPLNKLQVVYSLIPANAGAVGITGNEVMPATEGAANVTTATGTAVMPAPAQAETEFPLCEVCTSDFNESDQQPMLLPCGHVFCGWCIESLERLGHQECSICRKDWSNKSANTLPVVKELIHPENRHKQTPNKKRPTGGRPTQRKLSPTEVRDNASKLLTRSRTNSTTSICSDPEMELYVQDVNNKTHTVKARSSDPLSKVTDQLRQMGGQNVASQRLVHNGRTLSDQNKTLGSYGVTNYSSMHSTCRMKGGSNTSC